MKKVTVTAAILILICTLIGYSFFSNGYFEKLFNEIGITNTAAVIEEDENTDNNIQDNSSLNDDKDSQENEEDTNNLNTDENDKNNNDEEANNTEEDFIKKFSYLIFYANNDFTAIYPEKRYIEIKDNANIKAIVNTIIDGPESGDLTGVFPEGTSIVGINFYQDICTIDFSYNIVNTPKNKTDIMEATVLKSLYTAEGIEKIHLLTQGYELSGENKNESGIVSKELIDKYYPLYFVNEKGNKLDAEYRKINADTKEDLITEIVNRLIEGPKRSSWFKTIPEGTSLLGVSIDENTCTVDFSGEIITNHDGGSAGEEFTIYSIVNTLTKIDGIDKVMLKINGEIQDAFIHLALSEPFTEKPILNVVY